MGQGIIDQKNLDWREMEGTRKAWWVEKLASVIAIIC